MRVRAVTTGVAVLSLLGSGIAGAQPGVQPGIQQGKLQAHNDTYRVRADHAVTVDPARNDSGRPKTIVAHSAPAHGTLAENPDGTLRYTPAPGFTGTDSFDYTISDAVQRYRTNLPPLGTVGGVPITGGGYGSAVAPVPGSRDEFYGLTDRGPNVDGPQDNVKVEPLPGFTPAIGRFRLTPGGARLERGIPLRAQDGTPYNGRVNPRANTGEKILDMNGKELPPDPNGYDSEGLVALPDGTFWVSDEYGPFVTHFDRAGRALERLSPFDGSLPAELANRVPNKGMEGLTVTPDGRTLVGIMQSALQQPDLTKKPGNVTTVRIVTYDLRTHATREFLYLLDDPKTNSGAVSEITALSPTTFLVDERDGNPEPGAYKRLFRIDLTGATDVGPHARLPGASYDAAKGGLLVKDQTIEALVGAHDTAEATSDLTGAGITPVRKTPGVDLGGLLTGLNPNGTFFGHDKIEGVASTDGGRTLVISNDSDFGIDGLANDAPPFRLHAKTQPGGGQDDGEFLEVDTAKLPAATSTARVTVTVTR
jgi:hypothetical protein